MLNVQPFRSVLKPGDAQRIQDGAIRLLCEHGIACSHKKGAELLVEKGGITYKNERLLFDRERTEAFLEQLKREQSLLQDSTEQAIHFSMGGNWNSLELCDPATNRPRPANTGEAIWCARLSSLLGGEKCPIPVVPSDVPIRLRTVACERIAVTHTPCLGGWLTATDPEEIRVIAAMHQAAGRKYVLGLEGLITPLRVNPVVFDTYFEWCDSPDLDIYIMGGIPVAGTTAPMPFPANLMVSLAETIALDYIFNALSDGKHRCFNLRMELADMKNANLSFGTPEQCLCFQAVYEMAYELFGIKPAGGAFRTNGKVVDAQTLTERMGSFLFQAAFGARRFGGVGQICLDEVFSPVQAMLDKEILRYGERLFGGMPEECFDRELDIIELLEEGESLNGFLAHETTGSRFRSIFDLGRLSSASFLSEWKQGGMKTLEILVWEEGKKMLTDYDFELPAENRREVDRLYAAAQRLLL